MQQTPQTPSTHMGQRLAPMHQLDDYKVADGEPDIRGWSVRTADGRVAGKVDDLIVDTQAM
jgi:photosynthetic reaction center H subunit